MFQERIALADTVTSRLQEELRSLCAEFEAYWRESKKKLDDVSAPYHKLRARLPKSDWKRVQYIVEKRQLSFLVDAIGIEKTSFYGKQSGPQFNYGDA